MSVNIDTRISASLDRRRALQERIVAADALAQHLDRVLGHDPESGRAPVDPDGTLRVAVRALIGVAGRTPGFDTTVCTGESPQWGVRVRHTAQGLVADIVPARQGAGLPPTQRIQALV